MNRTAYFRNGRWHITLTDSPQDHGATTTADIPMMQLIRQDMQGARMNLIEGGNWDRRAYRDEFYPIQRFCKASYDRLSDDETLAATRAMLRSHADRQHAAFRWMIGRRG